jgi:hypothetical protein
MSSRRKGRLVAWSFFRANGNSSGIYSIPLSTTAFDLIEDEQRIWGVDYDDLRGWHVHPADDPDQHRDIDPMTPSEIVEALPDAWKQLL